MSSVRKSLAWTSLDSYASVALQFAGTVVISRLLSPAELGVFAVAAVFAAVASTVRDLGIGEFLIREPKVDDGLLRTAFGLSLVVSWAIAALLAFLAVAAGGFYGESGVTHVMFVQVLNFLLIPFGSVTMAWFRREMKFAPFVACRMTGNLSAFATSVALALQGWGYMSLAWASVVGTAVTVLMTLALRPAHLPRRPTLKGAARILQFGKHVSAIYVLGQLGRGAPELIIGRAAGMTQVGLFSRANGLIEVFNLLVVRAVTPVCLPYFASEARANGSVAAAQTRAAVYLTGLAWPFFAAMAVVAELAIRVVYGPQWADSVPVARVLCLAAAVECMFFTVKEALLAVGQAAEANRLQLWTQGWRVLGLMAVIPFGLAGAAWGLVAAAVVAGVVVSQTMRNRLHVTLAGLAPGLTRSAAVAASCAAVELMLLHRWPLDPGRLGLQATAAAGLGILAWLAAALAVGHPLLGELSRMFGSARDQAAS